MVPAWGFSAVPVLPATSTGRDFRADAVPPSSVTARRPSWIRSKVFWETGRYLLPAVQSVRLHCVVVDDLAHKMGLVALSIGRHSRKHFRNLHGCCQGKALTNGCIERIAQVPFVFKDLFLVSRGCNKA